MAKVEKIILVDDLDGGPAEVTVRFAIDGSAYEIDLSKKNAQKLREALDPFVAKARRAGKAPKATGRSRTRPSIAVDREQNQAIRTWAKKKGFKVNDRGRIPAEIAEKYHAAHA